MKAHILIVLVASSGCATHTPQHKVKKDWHTPSVPIKETTIIDDTDSFPNIPIQEIEKVKIGMTLDNILRLLEFGPYFYYYDVDYSIVYATDGSTTWEVAFLMDEEETITDISYKKIEVIKVNDPFNPQLVKQR
jgi:hypothetical protein